MAIKTLIIKLIMQKSTTFGLSPNRKSRLKTQKTQSQSKSYIIESPTFLTARNNSARNLYMDILIQQSRISQSQGFTSIKPSQNEQSKPREGSKQKSRYVVFKNLQEFDLEIKTQKGNLEKANIQMKAFGIATFRGLGHAINNHHISAHIGQPTSFSLIQGYDGHFAASQLKKCFVNQLNTKFRKQKGNSREEPFRLAEENIKSAFQSCKKQLFVSQNSMGDDSGASLLSLIVHKGISFVTNCGASGALCMMTSGQLLRLAEPHTTKNQQQIKRILKAGGQFYQTTINFPYKAESEIRGPMRVFPEGLTITRTLGKSLSNSKKKQKTVSDVNTSRRGIIRELQINYIPTSEIRWLSILSSKVVEKLKPNKIKDLIQQELSKCNANYYLNEAAQHSSKRIILQAFQSGVKQSLSALVIFGQCQVSNLDTEPKKQSWCLKAKANQSQVKSTLTPQPKSLTYIGKRVNFVQVQNQV